MKISIENLGPIKAGQVDLDKRLTVFSGPNNSGKTYVAFLIYALIKANYKFYRQDRRTNFVLTLIQKKTIRYDISIDEVWKYRKEELESIVNSLDSIFGISSDVVSQLFSLFKIDIIQSKEELQDSILKMNFTNRLSVNGFNIEVHKSEGDDFIELKTSDKIVTKENIEFSELFLESKLLSLIAFYPFTNSHILPVERNSIYTFSKELSIKKQEFLDRAQELSSNTKKDPFHWLVRRSTRYPLPIRDGLEIAEDLSNFSSRKGEFYSLAKELELDLLNGQMILSKDGEVQFASNKAKTKKIPIHLSASIVKTLSSFVFYLKHIASKNDLIIIDEPELNLHPNNQVVLTRFFAKLIQKGFRLLISTHSDYIIRELNNLIMISSLKTNIDEIREKYGYSEDMVLHKEDVGAYLFNYKNSKSRNITIKKIRVTESGFDVSTIDDTIDLINKVSEELFMNIKYGVKVDG